ncbi:root phototropism protein 3-like [Vigna umbellata]|uniref:root phototropism protein 3-like n=1 Tax=Vigna umbellata TaxID=87088 RepID=UPI001F5F97CC|nr:root phototropism protein 3-like [Vigna umbellata]
MMKKRFEFAVLEKGTVGGKSVDPCNLLPPNLPVLAHSLEHTQPNWIARSNSPTDLIIQIGDSSFHLHKLVMASRSEYLNRLVFERGSNRESAGESLIIQIKNLPGGTKSFKSIVKFCYGRKFDITASNIVPLYCAAHFLEMSEDLQQGNLISKTETFLTFLIISSWKDTFRILKTTESVSHWAKDLQIVKRCSQAIALKVCADPNASSFTCQSETDNSVYDWWFEDVSFLRIDHFIEVIQSIKRCGIKPELVSSCIERWTRKWFSQVTLGLDKETPKSLTLHRISIECLINILPAEENSVTCNFLLHLLKVGVMLKINSELLCVLERRVALMLDKCRVPDLLVKNQQEKHSVYDVTVVLRVLRFYVCGMSSNHSAKAKPNSVGRLVDGYLMQVARDENLTMESFKSIVEALPQNARHCDDNLYRAIDMYLKAHPNLTEEDRTDISRNLEYHRLSQEARKHVMQNDRLPLKLTTEFVLLEQVNMTTSMTSNGSSYRRTNAQTIMRVNQDLERREIVNAQEINMMRKDVEMIKSQLLKVYTCKLKLQKQLKGCIR